MSKIKAFPYFGGKLSHLNFILENLPYTERYIEPFGGSAAVLLNREPSPVETYNDLDGDVVNFFRVLREQPDELVRQLELTPYSREEFAKAWRPDDSVGAVERARRFFVRVSQGYNAKTNPTSSPENSGGEWSYAVGNSRNGRSKKTSQWSGYLCQLEKVADRLRRVQIENQDAINLIETHDHPDALVYCDPPYPPTSRYYGEYAHEMSDQDHRELADTLNQCEAKVAISNYESDLMRELYTDWNVLTGEEKTLNTSIDTSSNTELLITNYEPRDGNAVQTVSETGGIQNRLSEFATE